MASIRVGRGAAAVRAADIDELLSRRSTPARSQQPSLALMWQGIRSGQSDAFFALARSSGDVVIAKDEGGATALHWFALRGEDDNCRRVLSMGAQVRIYCCRSSSQIVDDLSVSLCMK